MLWPSDIPVLLEARRFNLVATQGAVQQPRCDRSSPAHGQPGLRKSRLSALTLAVTVYVRSKKSGPFFTSTSITCPACRSQATSPLNLLQREPGRTTTAVSTGSSGSGGGYGSIGPG